MAFVFHRDLRIPLWAVAFGAVIVTGTPAPPPPLVITVGIAIVAVTAMAMLQRRRLAPVLIDVQPIINRARPEASRTSDPSGGDYSRRA